MIRKAVIDLGTNTCNLLIADVENESFQPIFRKTRAVLLGKGGMKEKTLSIEGFERALAAILEFKKICDQYKVVDIKIFATSAVRNAQPQIQKDFISGLFSQTGLSLNVIHGNKESDLIYKGVSQAVKFTTSPKLILDIGGGSNEFIIANSSGKIWERSFDLGMARVIQLFKISNPITQTEIEQIKTYFSQGLQPLWDKTKDIVIDDFVGCSGAFDTFADLIEDTKPNEEFRSFYNIPLKRFAELSTILLKSTIEERRLMKGMVEVRAQMILPALILVNLIIETLHPNTVHTTGHSLCEGAIIN